MVNSDIGKFAIGQGLAYAPKLLDVSASKSKNKKVRQLLQSEMTKKKCSRKEWIIFIQSYTICQLEVSVFQLKTWKIFL